MSPSLNNPLAGGCSRSREAGDVYLNLLDLEECIELALSVT